MIPALTRFDIDINEVKGVYLCDQEGVEIPKEQFTSIVNQFIGCNHFRITIQVNSVDDCDAFTSVSRNNLSTSYYYRMTLRKFYISVFDYSTGIEVLSVQ